MALTYDYKEYCDNSDFKKVCEGKAKAEQETILVSRIMDILNSKKIDLDEFIKTNSTLQSFLSNDSIANTAIKHVNTFGNPINEEDYIQMLERLKTIKKQKESFKTDDIKTSTIDSKEKTEQYNSLEIDEKYHYLDNSDSNKTIEKRMSDIQNENKEFQTIDADKNTENMFKHLEGKQEEINFESLNQINYFDLSQIERNLYDKAFEYQIKSLFPVKVNLKKGLMTDNKGSVIKIEESGKILDEENGMQLETGESKDMENSYQKVLTHSSNTIYSN